MKASLNIILNQSISTDLKKAFVADKTIQKMAKEDFIMLNVVVIKDMLHMQKNIYISINILLLKSCAINTILLYTGRDFGQESGT